MKLKRLSLQGYKTFASKTEFLFDEGITAIVGPNGSGKSNIADALRWVLGEQSYSTLRGKRTEDMIFAGSESRPRSGMAQAILMLDNSDKWLPIDFSEVEIGRRAFRSGENEYILNGQKVRLKDVSDLLATSGLAQRTYTIIGQGLVDQALSLRADERRALFEEAAGVNHYKSRRAETLRRLNETQHNLERVHDILAEIKPRLSSLKRQATRARNYEQIRQELHELLRIWYGYRWEQSKAELRVAREGAAASEKAWQSSRQALLVHQQNADDLQRQINRQQNRLTEAQDQREEARLTLEKTRREMAILQERREAIQRRLGDLEQEEPLLQEQRATAEAELSAATVALTTAQSTLHDSRASLQGFNSSFEVQQAEARRQRAALRKAEDERRAAQNNLAQGEGQLSQLQERLRDRQAEQNGSSAEEMARLEQEKDQQLKVLATAQQSKDRLSEQREAAQRERQEQIDELKQLRRDAREQERALGQQRDRVARLEARVDLLDQMRHKEIDFGKDIPVLGRLASLITIPDGHKQALEAAQSARLATLVVEKREALWALIARNAERPLTVAALADVRVPLPPAPPRHAGVIGWAAEKINIKKNARPLLDVLFGRVLLVADRETAYAVAGELPPGAMAVAPDGFIVHAGGVVETVPAAGKDGILAREEAWREAQEALAVARQELAKIEAATVEQQQIVNTRQEAVDGQQNEERRLGRMEAEAAQRVAQAQRRVDRAQQQQDFLQRQQESQAQEITRLQSRIETLQASLTGSREKLQTLDQTISERQAQLAELPVAEGEQEQQRLQQAVSTAQTIVAGRQAVVDSRRTTLNQVEQQLARLAERRTTLLKQQAELENEVETDDAQRLNERLAQLDATVEPLQRRIRELRQELQTLQSKSGKLQRHAHEMETQYTQSQVRLTQRENQIESLQERIRADLGLVALSYDEDQTGASPLPLQEFVEQLPTVEELPPQIEQNIHQYRGQLQRMGAINPDAPEEFEETQERHDFLTQQIEDLNQAEHHLRGVIAELDELTSRAFAETVHRVDNVFGDTFTQLFGGGSARLVLTEPDDLTVSGVDIIARLPNRREQGLGLLSGGERSLTASALIFSLLKVSPTPFCVLDEVDAALDEANVNRFTDILRELSMTTQFIVITHNRGTVQAAETIYGVSMQPDSASQVISLKPSEYMKVEML